MLTIRNATVLDVETITKLVDHYAKKGLLLPKSAFKVYSKLQSFLIAEENKRIVGCASLVVLWKDLAEICSLAVEPGYVRKGVGKKLAEHCIEKARSLKVPQVIALTYQDEFFQNMGFQQVDKDTFPRKLMWECLECPKLEQCDEHAYIADLEQIAAKT